MKFSIGTKIFVFNSPRNAVYTGVVIPYEASDNPQAFPNRHDHISIRIDNPPPHFLNCWVFCPQDVHRLTPFNKALYVQKP